MPTSPSGGSKDPDRGFSVCQLDSPELAAGFEALEDCDCNQPYPHHVCRSRAADRDPMIGQHAAILRNPAAKVAGTASHDDVRLAVPPMLERARVCETGRKSGAPLPGEIAAVVEL